MYKKQIKLSLVVGICFSSSLLALDVDENLRWSHSSPLFIKKAIDARMQNPADIQLFGKESGEVAVLRFLKEEAVPKFTRKFKVLIEKCRLDVCSIAPIRLQEDIATLAKNCGIPLECLGVSVSMSGCMVTVQVWATDLFSFTEVLGAPAGWPGELLQ